MQIAITRPRCDRVNIAVTDGQQRGHTPPDAAECIAENVRLSVVLDTIHAHAARQHQHHDDEHRGNDLVPFFIEYGGNDVERVVFRIEPEQMENPRHAQHTENDEARQKKTGMIVSRSTTPSKEMRKQNRARPGVFSG